MLHRGPATECDTELLSRERVSTVSSHEEVALDAGSRRIRMPDAHRHAGVALIESDEFRPHPNRDILALRSLHEERQ